MLVAQVVTTSCLSLASTADITKYERERRAMLRSRTDQTGHLRVDRAPTTPGRGWDRRPLAAPVPLRRDRRTHLTLGELGRDHAPPLPKRLACIRRRHRPR